MQAVRGVGSKANRVALIASLLLAALLAGCVGTTIPAATATEPSPAMSSPTLETAGDDTAGYLVSRWVDSPLEMDGQIEDAWATAESLQLPLTWGLDGTEHALDVELRALHTDNAIYFLALWSGESPSGEENTVLNKLTLHWRIPEPAAQGLDCSVVCHTAFADGSGRFVYANAETIPQGGHETLSAAGNWHTGTWTLEWGRPLSSANPYDLQFDDLDQDYAFLVKVFEQIEGRPDPISERHLLVFQPRRKAAPQSQSQ